MFLLENSTGLQTIRYKVCEASIKGAEVQCIISCTQFFSSIQVAAAAEELPSSQKESVLKVTIGDAEWNFLKQGHLYVLYFVNIKLSPSTIRKYLSLAIES